LQQQDLNLKKLKRQTTGDFCNICDFLTGSEFPQRPAADIIVTFSLVLLFGMNATPAKFGLPLEIVEQESMRAEFK